MLSNDEILGKCGIMTKDVIDLERRTNIEKLVMGLEKIEDMAILGKTLAVLTKHLIA